MIIEHNNKKWFIREDMGTGFYIENGNVFAVPLDVSGLPHDDGFRTNEVFTDKLIDEDNRNR